MKLTVESTAHLVSVDGVQCRLWQGVDEDGDVVSLLVHRVAIDTSADATAFQRELREMAAPAELDAVRERARGSWENWTAKDTAAEFEKLPPRGKR